MTEDELLKLIVVLPWVLFLALAGGLAAFIMRLNHASVPQPIGKIFLSLLGELFLSGFAGFITFLICRYYELAPMLTAVLVAVSGHMGGNAIDKIVQTFSQKIDQKTKL